MIAETWVAIGTWALAVGTWALVGITYLLAKGARQDAKEQVQAAQQAARDQMAVTERIAQAHMETLREDLRARLLLHYETRWDPAGHDR